MEALWGESGDSWSGWWRVVRLRSEILRLSSLRVNEDDRERYRMKKGTRYGQYFKLPHALPVSARIEG
jgi:hypothetical protein